MDISGSAARISGQIVTGLATALSLVLDAAQVTLRGDEPPWQVIAGGAFLVFVVLVAWQQLVMYREIHDPEHKIEVDVLPDPFARRGKEWHRLSLDQGTGRVAHFIASMDLDLTNRDSFTRTVNECWADLLIYPRGLGWCRPLGKRLCSVEPFFVGADGEWYKRERRRVVNFELPASGPIQTKRIYFAQDWDITDSATPKLDPRQKYDVVLVLTVGGRNHTKRVKLAGSPKADPE